MYFMVLMGFGSFQRASVELNGSMLEYKGSFLRGFELFQSVSRPIEEF